MFIRESVDKKSIAKVENIATRPFGRRDGSKFGVQMNTASDVSQGDNATQGATAPILERRDLVHQVVGIRILKR